MLNLDHPNPNFFGDYILCSKEVKFSNFNKFQDLI